MTKCLNVNASKDMNTTRKRKLVKVYWKYYFSNEFECLIVLMTVSKHKKAMKHEKAIIAFERFDTVINYVK